MILVVDLEPFRELDMDFRLDYFMRQIWYPHSNYCTALFDNLEIAPSRKQAFSKYCNGFTGVFYSKKNGFFPNLIHLWSVHFCMFKNLLSYMIQVIWKKFGYPIRLRPTRKTSVYHRKPTFTRWYFYRCYLIRNVSSNIGAS